MVFGDTNHLSTAHILDYEVFICPAATMLSLGLGSVLICKRDGNTLNWSLSEVSLVK